MGSSINKVPVLQYTSVLGGRDVLYSKLGRRRTNSSDLVEHKRCPPYAQAEPVYADLQRLDPELLPGPIEVVPHHSLHAGGNADVLDEVSQANVDDIPLSGVIGV